jgi:hypothetical protein
MIPATFAMLHAAPASGQPPVPLVAIIDVMQADRPQLTVDDVTGALNELLGRGLLRQESGRGGPVFGRTPVGDQVVEEADRG